jgi:3,4-dihydroxy 2-butanone 4-phosphate synthase/GTP cyclohydrolase II
MTYGLASTAELIDEARNGRMFILVDDEDRENEGDLVIPAQLATPNAVNFMAAHGRGLICLALTRERVDQLGLDMMSGDNRTRHETAFTVSIEARHGVTTGISAADRARTIAVAIDGTKGSEHIVTPGHVFPLVARRGGVLVRAGHTEAAVDISRLAGLNPSGVICEIMREDGQMARLDDLVAFAEQYNLKIGTIRDLIAYRREHDHNVVRTGEALFDSEHGGQWRAVTFRNTALGSETLALIKGQVSTDRPALVRMHTLNIFHDSLGERSDRTGLLQAAMRLIADEGSGVVVIINRVMENAMTTVVRAKVEGKPLESPELSELRDYGVGAQILAELGIKDMILLTNSRHTLVGLSGYGLNIVGERRIELHG